WLVACTGCLVERTQASSRVYTLAALRALEEGTPARWAGRTVVVRALAEPCPWWGATARLQHCAGQSLVLIGTATDAPTAPLPLVRPVPSPLWAVLSRLPWLGDRLPRPKPVDPFVPARFKVRLLALPSCAGAGCDEALLDAAPDALGQG